MQGFMKEKTDIINKSNQWQLEESKDTELVAPQPFSELEYWGIEGRAMELDLEETKSLVGETSEQYHNQE